MKRTSYLPAVVQATYVTDYLVDVIFDNGTEKRIDISQWFKGPVFEPLRDKAYFRKFFIDSTTITWPNGADIAPEALYEAAEAAKASAPPVKRRK